MIRYALVGVGQHARWAVIPALGASVNSQLVAACDLRQENLDAIEDPSVVKFNDYDAMLETGGFDVVYVATLEDLHEMMVTKALEAGYHVLCEKPLGMNTEECENMLAAEKKSGKKLVVGFEKRYHPDVIMMKKWIQDGRIGKVEAIHFQEMWDMHKTIGKLSKRREDHLDRSGSLDCGIHNIDNIRYMTGAKAWSNITARGRWFGELERKQMPHISLMGDLDTGALVTITESYAYCTNISPKHRCDTHSIIGTEGVINWADDGNNELELKLVTESSTESHPHQTMHHHEAIELVTTDLSKYLLGESPWPDTLATGEDGLIAQQVVDQALAQTHQNMPK